MIEFVVTRAADDAPRVGEQVVARSQTGRARPAVRTITGVRGRRHPALILDGAVTPVDATRYVIVEKEI